MNLSFAAQVQDCSWCIGSQRCGRKDTKSEQVWREESKEVDMGSSFDGVPRAIGVQLRWKGPGSAYQRMKGWLS
jgi:hypothetical protein